MKYVPKILGSIVLFAAMAGCVSPAATPVPTALPPTSLPPETPLPQPSPTTAQPTGKPGLFTLFKEVQVTPAGNFLGGAFVRTAYVPGKDRMVVTFAAELNQPEGGCNNGYGYAYGEFNRDMVATGDYGVISCFAATDVGGLFVENDFYLASMGHDNNANKEGWHLTKFDAVTWTILAGPIFHSLDGTEMLGESPVDPMLAFVNGRIDVRASYKFSADEDPGPFAGHATHHQFFTTGLQFADKRILSDVPHVQLNSMIVAGGVTHFVAATSLLGGDIVVMRYDKEWTYLGVKLLLKNASTPEGIAFDGKRFYLAYLDNSLCATFPCYQNVRLAAFDADWNLLEDVAVTEFTPDDHTNTARPSLAYWNGRVYVCYDQTENETHDPAQDPETLDTHVQIKVYALTNP
jgi:hypothetical protein